MRKHRNLVWWWLDTIWVRVVWLIGRLPLPYKVCEDTFPFTWLVFTTVTMIFFVSPWWRWPCWWWVLWLAFASARIMVGGPIQESSNIWPMFDFYIFVSHSFQVASRTFSTGCPHLVSLGSSYPYLATGNQKPEHTKIGWNWEEFKNFSPFRRQAWLWSYLTAWIFSSDVESLFKVSTLNSRRNDAPQFGT